MEEMLDKFNYYSIFWCYKKRSDVWINFSFDSKNILFSLCENCLSTYNIISQGIDLTGLKCYSVVIFR